jgi:transcriptional regulator with PAS, ATPase and Fis domain
MYQNHIAQIYQAVHEPQEILGTSFAMREVKDLISRTASASVAVCILGETGTGKELVANAIHQMSRRADKPFVKINCAAIPKDLMESELFGYEPGAFTNASRRGKLGKFELANHGTLLLDEIGELSPELQVKLLRVLQAGEVERVGGTSPIPIDVRVLCSTNRYLPQMVREGTFRADLYYRINTMEITVPPLRDRREDIPQLANHFTEEASTRNGLVITGISDAAVEVLMEHDWPGNVRELEHAIERACVLCGRGQLEPRHFNSITRSPISSVSSDQKENTAPSLKDKTGSLEKESILQALEACHGNKRAAAAALGITRTTLYSKLKKYDIAL